MLHLETISGETLDLLKGIQALELGEMRLVGGTALALQYGHRKSIDLDFFGIFPDDSFENIFKSLQSLGKAEVMKRSKSILVFSINGVKVDFVDYSHYPWISDPVYEKGIIMASDKDISAMKISAITGRGTKKDFWDLYYLLENYSLKDILNMYSQKYPDGSEYLALKSLIYFYDADENEDPSPTHKVKWDQVKDRIRSEHKKYMDNLNL